MRKDAGSLLPIKQQCLAPSVPSSGKAGASQRHEGIWKPRCRFGSSFSCASSFSPGAGQNESDPTLEKGSFLSQLLSYDGRC